MTTYISNILHLLFVFVFIEICNVLSWIFLALHTRFFVQGALYDLTWG